MRGYSKNQQDVFDLIRSLQDHGMGYRKIANHLNALYIRTSRGREFKNTHINSVLKRYRERQKRIKDVREKQFEVEYGKFELKRLED